MFCYPSIVGHSNTKKQGNETKTMFIGHFSVCMSRVSQRKLCHFFISKRAAVHVYNSTLQDCPTMAGGQLSKRALWSSTSVITGHSRCFWVRFSDKWNGHDNFWSKMKHGHGAESSNSEFILADTMYLMTVSDRGLGGNSKLQRSSVSLYSWMLPSGNLT
jgi:hypothetical protein